MTGYIVPCNSIIIFVVKNSKTSFIVKLLKTLNGDTNVVLSVDGTMLDAFKVVWLSLSLLPSGAPVSLTWSWFVSGWDTMIVSSCPEPAVNIDRSQVGSITSFVLEVTLASTRVN